jgi:hypothetical protein
MITAYVPPRTSLAYLILYAVNFGKPIAAKEDFLPAPPAPMAFEFIDEALATLHQQSITDALTRLHNRRYLYETLPREIVRAQEQVHESGDERRRMVEVNERMSRQLEAAESDVTAAREREAADPACSPGLVGHALDPGPQVSEIAIDPGTRPIILGVLRGRVAMTKSELIDAVARRSLASAQRSPIRPHQANNNGLHGIQSKGTTIRK